jgi:hypothetical protein
MLFDIMSEHNREVDDLDYLLRDALWSSSDTAPEPARVLAALRTRIVTERRPALVAWPRIGPTGNSAMSASYWYYMPLLRVLR